MDYKRLIWEGHHYRFGLAGEDQADAIQTLLDGHPGRALNVGCGPWGDKLRNLAPHCLSLFAADKAKEAVRLAAAQACAARVHLVVAEGDRLPFGTASFDYVLALGLFAEVRNPEAVIQEMSRVCRSGAHVMITNAVMHPRTRFQAAGEASRLELVDDQEGYCPAASGIVKRRYLLVFRKC